MTTEEVLKQCKVEDNVVKLPNVQLEPKEYASVKKSLEKIGGKWKGGKVFGFVFTSDPTDLLSDISGGVKRNLKKEFQFFGTPVKLADYLVKLAEIKNGEIILEPSAGQGAIIEAIYRVNKTAVVIAIELMKENSIVLTNKGFTHNIQDFLTSSLVKQNFDKIIANPPFSKNQDIDHIRKMYDCLKPGGRIVTVASKHWQESKNKKETEFREWLNSKGAKVQEIPSGTFKESGTNIASVVIIINK